MKVLISNLIIITSIIQTIGILSNPTLIGGSGVPLFDSGPVPPGMLWDSTFDSVGTFGYHCSIHSWMTGRVMVG